MNRRLSIIGIILCVLFLGCQKQDPNKLLFQRMIAITEDNHHYPLGDVAGELLNIGEKSTDSDLKYFATNFGHLCKWYSGCGIGTLDDISKKGLLEKSLRVALETVTNPGKVYDAHVELFKMEGKEDMGEVLTRLKVRYE